MQKHLTHKKASGFTLIELLIVIAIIGILAAIAIPQFNQYKIRGYDTSAKQALRDVTLLCNAYWIDNDCSQECTLPKIMAAAYGFNQNSDLDVTLPSAASQCSNFCASAKSNSSPNTYSIDSAALISSGSTCSGVGGSVQPALWPVPGTTYENYKPPEEACSSGVGRAGGFGRWYVVKPNGALAVDKLELIWTCEDISVACDRCPTSSCRGVQWPKGMPFVGWRADVCEGSDKLVYAAPSSADHVERMTLAEATMGQPGPGSRYNFATGIWSNEKGEKFKNGKLVE